MIKNGCIPDADEVLSAMGRITRELIEKIIGTESYKRIIYDIFDSDTATTSSNVEYVDGWYFGPVGFADSDLTTIDEFNDTTVDSNLWDISDYDGTFSVTEDGTYQVLDISAGASPEHPYGRSKLKLDLINNYSTLVRILWGKIYYDTGYGNCTGKVCITDGTNTIVLFSKTFSSGTGTDDTDYLIDIIIAGNLLFHKVNTNNWVKEDITSWDKNNITIYFEAGGYTAGYNDGIQTKLYIDWIRYYNFNSPPMATIETQAITTSEVVTNAVGYYINEGADPEFYVTSNGSDYYKADENGLVRFENTGTTMKVIFEYINYTECFALRRYGMFINFY